MGQGFDTCRAARGLHLLYVELLLGRWLLCRSVGYGVVLVCNLTDLEQKKFGFQKAEPRVFSDDPNRLCERIIIGGNECNGCSRR